MIQIKVVEHFKLGTKNSVGAYIYLPAWSGTRGLERLIWLKYYRVQKRQITFNLEQLSIFIDYFQGYR